LDLDLMSRDGNELIETLAAGGFEPSSLGICHEFGSMRHEFFGKIDIHKYFPVWSYKVPSERNAAQTEHLLDFGRLEFADLLETAVRDLDVNSPLALMPGREMTALILALHVFRDYVENPTVKPVAKIRIGEIFEYSALVHTSDFSQAIYRGLALKHNALAAISFTNAMCRFAGIGQSGSLDEAALASSSLSSMPREVGRGLMEAGPRNPLDLFVHPSAQNLNSSSAPEGVQRIAESTEIRRHVPEGGARIDFDVRQIRDEHWAKFVINVRCAQPGHYKDEVNISTPGWAVRAQAEPQTGEVLKPFNDIENTTDWVATPHGWTATLTVPTRHLTAFSHVAICAYRYVEPLTSSWGRLYTSALASTMLRFPLERSAFDTEVEQ
jgi:hypothetical protein